MYCALGAIPSVGHDGNRGPESNKSNAVPTTPTMYCEPEAILQRGVLGIAVLLVLPATQSLQLPQCPARRPPAPPAAGHCGSCGSCYGINVASTAPTMSCAQAAIRPWGMPGVVVLPRTAVTAMPTAPTVSCKPPPFRRGHDGNRSTRSALCAAPTTPSMPCAAPFCGGARPFQTRPAG